MTDAYLDGMRANGEYPPKSWGWKSELQQKTEAERCYKAGNRDPWLRKFVEHHLPELLEETSDRRVEPCDNCISLNDELTQVKLHIQHLDNLVRSKQEEIEEFRKLLNPKVLNAVINATPENELNQQISELQKELNTQIFLNEHLIRVLAKTGKKLEDLQETFRLVEEQRHAEHEYYSKLDERIEDKVRQAEKALLSKIDELIRKTGIGFEPREGLHYESWSEGVTRLYKEFERKFKEFSKKYE